MNDYYKREITYLRLKYPLRKTIVLNPIIGIIKDENEVEVPSSEFRNNDALFKFGLELKNAYENENTYNTEAIDFYRHMQDNYSQVSDLYVKELKIGSEKIIPIEQAFEEFKKTQE